MRSPRPRIDAAERPSDASTEVIGRAPRQARQDTTGTGTAGPNRAHAVPYRLASPDGRRAPTLALGGDRHASARGAVLHRRHPRRPRCAVPGCVPRRERDRPRERRARPGRPRHRRGKLRLPRPATARRSSRPDRTGRDVSRSPRAIPSPAGPSSQPGRQSRSSGTSSFHDDSIRTHDGSSALDATAARIRERARSGRARTASRSSGERHDVGRNSRAGRAERCVCGAGHHGPLGDPGAGALDGRPAARRPRVPPWRRPLRHPVDATPRLRRPILRLGRRVLAHWRHRRGGGCRRPFRPPAPAGLRRPEQARLLRCRARHGGRSRADRSPARGALSLCAATEPAGVRRLGVLDPEGEGDPLLR